MTPKVRLVGKYVVLNVPQSFPFGSQTTCHIPDIQVQGNPFSCTFFIFSQDYFVYSVFITNFAPTICPLWL